MRTRAGLSGRLGRLEEAAQAAAARRQVGQEPGRLPFDYAQYTADFQAMVETEPEWMDRLEDALRIGMEQWETEKQTQGAVI